MTRRIGIVGIDGAGKSSVVARLRELAPGATGAGAAAPTRFASMTCPDFHNTRDVPLADLSRQLKAFSVGCDEIGDTEMKLIAMFLQMTLFGCVERHFVDTYAPDVLVFERPPMIEVLVYGPLYTALARPDWTGKDRRDEIAAVLDRHRPGTFDDILDWYAAEARRLDLPSDIWTMLSQIAELVRQDVTVSLPALAQRFRTTLPDAVLWLDAPPEEAALRCIERAAGGTKEAHETADKLAALRENYVRVRETITQSFPDLAFHRIATGDGVDLEESVQACVREGRLFG